MDDDWDLDEDGHAHLSYMVYVTAEPKEEYEFVADIDDVIEAGIKALGLEGRYVFVESDMRDENW